MASRMGGFFVLKNMNTVDQIELTAHHKIYDSTSPIVNVPPEHILSSADPAQHGLVLKRPGESVPYASVRPPYFRTKQGDALVHNDDIVPLHAMSIPRSELEIPPAHNLTIGDEMELFTLAESVRLNGHQKIRPEWTAHSLERRLQSQGLATSSEVWNYMLEINGQPSNNIQQKAEELQTAGRIMARAIEAEEGNTKFLPVSSQPFIANPIDVNSHPYVQRMVMDFLKFQNITDLGCSYQIHIQTLDINSALYALNALRQLPPIFMAMALNGPFTQHQDTGLLSGREQARRKMATAGTNSRLPEWDDCVNYAVGILKQGTAPSLPRALTPHRDYRIRPDNSPTGTIEFAFLDNPGGQINKLIMFQSLFRQTTWRLYRAYANQEELPRQLFNMPYDDLITANKKAVEKDGVAALILDGNNNLTHVEDQLDNLLTWIKSDSQFINDPKYPIQTLEAEMSKSLSTPRFRSFDSTSMTHFYESGLGTPGHYQRARYEQLVDKHGPIQAINSTLVDYVDSYSQYLKTI